MRSKRVDQPLAGSAPPPRGTRLVVDSESCGARSSTPARPSSSVTSRLSAPLRALASR
ncbi:MAG: hypothetical protein U1F06_07845 [Steroidobacteraceae bacterium]